MTQEEADQLRSHLNGIISVASSIIKDEINKGKPKLDISQEYGIGSHYVSNVDKLNSLGNWSMSPITVALKILVKESQSKQKESV